MKDVKVYSTPTCPYCKMVKDLLSSKGVEYQDIDVAGSEEKLKEMIAVSGQMGVPVVVIGDEVIRGFNKEKIESLIS